MGFFSRQSKSSEPIASVVLPPRGQVSVVMMRQARNKPVKVVGESFNLKSIAAAVHKQDGEHMMVASLVREPKNKYDSNAVRVDLNGKAGGHIPSTEAPRYHSLLAAAERAGCSVHARCRVWYRSGTDEMASITLDMVDPAFAWPINPLAMGPMLALWPEGKPLKVSVSEDASASISQILARAYEPGACSAYLRIDAAPELTRLGVSFEGNLIGTLSPATSKQMGPVVEAARKRGRDVYVLAEVKGNSLVADVRVFAALAEELTEPQIQQLVG